MFENVREDLNRALEGNQHAHGLGALFRELFNPGTQAVLTYRFGAWANGIRFKPLRIFLKIVHFPFSYLFCWRMGIFFPSGAKIGPGLLIHTWGGGFIIPNCEIGKNLTFIGGGVQFDYEVREIGDDVSIAPGTKVIGKIRIGHRARTGPNSVINADVPDDCVAFGNPARIIGPVRRLTYEEGARRKVPATVRPGTEGTEKAQ